MGQTLPRTVRVENGEARPRGCTEEDGGGSVNFSLDAPGSKAAWIAFTLPEGHPGLEVHHGKGKEVSVLLDARKNRTGDTWHIRVKPDFPAKGVKYAWLLDPPLDGGGRPLPTAKRMIDPCAHALDSRTVQSWNLRDCGKYSPMAIVPDYRVFKEFDWQGVQPPGLHMKDLIIYEAHVRGFTKNPDSGLTDWDTMAGTYLGFIEKIPHLMKLGINCVELLPVFEFDETACPRSNPNTGEQLCNYWGYSTVCFACPMQRFNSRDTPGAAVVAFKTLVRELHRQGIEVMLDVVFNHTAEGTWGETNWHSLASISKSTYYLLSKGHDTNYTGCGNTMNANHPLCADWICECLRFWVDDMHVDGFRFDLASALCRGGDGRIQQNPELIRRMVQDPVLARVKLVAEPWDCSWPDGYLVGHFPSCGPPRWAEWNGKFRDTIRHFIKGGEGAKGDFATRVSGSSDLFKHNGRGPFHSVNFITAHDGFTLRDLVTYNEKHNSCNNENSGDDHNESWNCGHEGPTGDGAINHLRNRQMRNLLCGLLLSVGTPMITYGDEYGRSQQGCNNGWCQDKLSWFSWHDCAKEEGKLVRFTSLLMAFRKRHSHIFNRTSFLGDKDIWWRVHWDDPYNYICYVLHDDKGKDGYNGILIAYNAGHLTRSCDLPAKHQWFRIVDTNLVSPDDFCENEAGVPVKGNYEMKPYSCIVLTTHGGTSDAFDYSRSDDEYSKLQDVQEYLRTVIEKKMSLNFICMDIDPQEEEARDRLMIRSSMSGFILQLPSNDGEEPQFEMSRPNQAVVASAQEEAPAPTPQPAQVQVAPAFVPPVRAARPPLGKNCTEILTADLGGAKRVQVQVHMDDDSNAGTVLEVAVKGFGKEVLVLHWGSVEVWGGKWQNPPAGVLAASTPPSRAVLGANQTDFPAVEDAGCRRVYLCFNSSYMPMSVQFVLHSPPSTWLKYKGGDFTVTFPKSQKDIDSAIERSIKALPAGTSVNKKWTIQGFNLTAVGSVGKHGGVVNFLAGGLDGALMLHYGAGDKNDKFLFAKSADFNATQSGAREVTVSLPPQEITDRLMFVLKMGANHWVKDGNRDFKLELPEDSTLLEALAEVEQQKIARASQIRADSGKFSGNIAEFRRGRAAREKASVKFAAFELQESAGDIEVMCKLTNGAYHVDVVACLNYTVAPPTTTLLHWGTIHDMRRKEWQCPAEDMLPAGSRVMDTKAAQSGLNDIGDGLFGFTFPVKSRPSESEDAAPGETEPDIAGMAFVVHVPEGNKWIKCSDGKDCLAVFREGVVKGAWRGEWAQVANQIVDAERDWSHMTLMHRYNLAVDLIGKWLSDSSSTKSKQRMAPSWGSTFQRKSTVSFTRLPSQSLLADIESASVDNKNDEFWSWIFVWQRMSFIKVLDWQRNYNTKPRELAAATDGLANKLCEVWKEHQTARLWCRWTLATLGRGGNRGQEIRDEILHIMHRNKIPEVAGHFYEQWHQKLHNNTTPDDVAICKALIAFLRSNGDMNTYWRVLKDNGVTKERLASYDRKIDKEPYLHGDSNRLVLEFENYLKILQSVHDALDLQTSIDASRSMLSADLVRKLEDISRPSQLKKTMSRYLEDIESMDRGSLDSAHRRFMSLADARNSLLAILNDAKTNPGVVRQILLLDYSLETQQTVIIQGAGAENRLPVLCEQMRELLTAVLGHMPMLADMRAMLLDWSVLSTECAALRYNNNAKESALLLKAMVDRLARVVGEQVDTFQTLIGKKSMHLGSAVNAPKVVLDVFVDEILRGSALFSISLVLKRLEPLLRTIAALPPWQMISAVARPVQGEVIIVDKMLNMQDKIFETPTILISGMVSGEEEVPVGVQAVLVRDAASAPDILSHCAVRARNSGVLLATCFDPAIMKSIQDKFVGQWVELTCKQDGTVAIEKAERPIANDKMMRSLSRTLLRDEVQETLQSKPGETKLVNMNLTNDLRCKWVVTPDEMDNDSVGSKSLNLAKLKPLLPKDVFTPQAVAMPYGCMQKALTVDINSTFLPQLERCLSKLQPTSSNDEARGIFQRAQEITEQLLMPPELGEALSKAMEVVGKKDGDARLSKLYRQLEAWDSTKKVWASLFGLRPWVSLAKAHRSFHDLNMAVLVQEVISAKYAFVLHTKNPFTQDANEVYGELVPGRGETLVGNFPGRALSFRAKKGQDPEVSAFLSKSTWLRTQECLIFRSDSNGEDLEGFAGAGLFESICAKPDIPCMVNYHRLQIINDSAYRRKLLTRLAEVGRQVERAFGGMPQDIEGCVDPQDRIFIVQSRPQV